MIKRKYRLKNSGDIDHVRNTGNVYKHPYLILITSQNHLSFLRVGIIAGKGIGKAAHRNLVKRRLRVSMAQYLPEIEGGWDIIVIARKQSANVSFSDLQDALNNLLLRTGIYSPVNRQE